MIEPSNEIKLNLITSETLTPLVAKTLGVDSARIIERQYELVHGGMGEPFGTGLYRFRGRAEVQNQVRQWQLILKITRADVGYFSNDPSSWSYWKREALAYQSGLLDDLPGQLTAPRCFGFISSAVLFMALGAVGAWLPWLIEENGQGEVEDYLQQPIEKVLEQWSRMQSYLLDLGDEALALQEVIE
jgi:hypothetical protein